MRSQLLLTLFEVTPVDSEEMNMNIKFMGKISLSLNRKILRNECEASGKMIYREVLPLGTTSVLGDERHQEFNKVYSQF